MENERPLFDQQIQTRGLQMLKIAVPYVSGTVQKSLAIMVKYIELQKTMDIFNSGSMEALSISPEQSPKEKMFQMLSEMKSIMTEKEQENIDMMLNMFQVMSSYDMIFNQE